MITSSSSLIKSHPENTGPERQLSAETFQGLRKWSSPRYRHRSPSTAVKQARQKTEPGWAYHPSKRRVTSYTRKGWQAPSSSSSNPFPPPCCQWKPGPGLLYIDQRSTLSKIPGPFLQIPPAIGDPLQGWIYSWLGSGLTQILTDQGQTWLFLPADAG